jgi:hypothetical protein
MTEEMMPESSAGGGATVSVQQRAEKVGRVDFYSHPKRKEPMPLWGTDVAVSLMTPPCYVRRYNHSRERGDSIVEHGQLLLGNLFVLGRSGEVGHDGVALRVVL